MYYEDPRASDDIVVKLPPSFHVMIKPRGPVCNLDCEYCYYLAKEKLYPGSKFRMDTELLESFVEQALATPNVPEVVFGWQGGEPTLMGLDFFREVVALQRKYRQKGRQIRNAIQTNGTLLDAEWCRFLKAEKFMVGVSLDGPRELHDAYRVDKGGKPTFDRVMAGIKLLRQYKVPFNILTTLHAANVPYPLEVYRFLRDEVRTQHIQFIPIVEHTPGLFGGVSNRSVTGKQYGDFLIAIFSEWVRRDVGKVYVQIFEESLAAWTGRTPSLCVMRETCGGALAMEHNGDLYSCDHFVTPAYKLGNIRKDWLLPMVGSEEQQAFGNAKRDELPEICKSCDVRFVCNGGCPKDRFASGPFGKPENYLCDGYKAFFTTIRPAMEYMARELAAHRPATSVMRRLALHPSANTD